MNISQDGQYWKINRREIGIVGGLVREIIPAFVSREWQETRREKHQQNGSRDVI
jgi:hypothetical protein